MKDINKLNLINIDDLKERRSLKSYYDVLSFNELIQEANHTISELNEGDLTNEKTRRTLVLLDEFKKRLKHPKGLI